MTHPKAVFLDLATIDRQDLSLAQLQQTLFDWTFHDHTAPEQTLQRIQGAQLVVSNKVVLDQAILRQSPGLKLICVSATGTNNIDLDAASKLGMVVTNVSGYATPAVSQHVFAMILSLTTRLEPYQNAVARGDWGRSQMFCLLDYPIRELAGKRLGIVGYGDLGRGVERIARAFDMEVLLAQRPGGSYQHGRVPLTDLLPQVDILSLHCPLTEQTRNLIGTEELALMRPDALLINTARGGIVDEPALAAALKSGRLGGAGFDVLSQEPPVNGNPLLEPGIPNLIITPHTAWASRESRQRLLDGVAANIRSYLNGESLNRIEI